MPIPSPNLDDRTFQQLVEAAKLRVTQADCGWTDLSPSDPGTVLLEVFAYLTELMIYRLNRLPDKVYVELLRLMGVQLFPPSAARAKLRFSVSRPQKQAVTIPKGTRVTLARSGGSEAPTFVTLTAATIPADDSAVDVLGYHCTLVEGELAGLGTGSPRQSVRASRTPIVAPAGEGPDLVVGIEAKAGELAERVPALTWEGKTFRIWREVENFTEIGQDGCVFVADRMSGLITFAPAVRAIDAEGNPQRQALPLADVPNAGREIRLWYRAGGGESGNVAANTLVVLKDSIPGVQVTNPEPATGGLAAESLQNALLRGPQEIHSLRRAVTARDFETFASRTSGAVARARAFTKAEFWRHAKPGTVEVLIVPNYLSVDHRGGGAVTADKLVALETEEARARILENLEQRRPLGTICLVNWVRYKTVQVKVRVVVYRGEDTAAVKTRVTERLHLAINPLPTSLQQSGWRFGDPLRASHVYDIVLAEPGVSYADQVRLLVDEVPEADVRALAADPSQPGTWYAASAQTLFRSLNNGDGWEAAGRFQGETVAQLSANSQRPGLLGVATKLDGGAARVHVSRDCGETWAQAAETAFAINQLAWLERGETDVLLMATDQGLYELALEAHASPIQVEVDPAHAGRGLYAVLVFTDARGGLNVAVAQREEGGIFLSRQGGKTGTFRKIGFEGRDARVLGVQREGMRSFLWAGLATAGNEPGTGCYRWELPAEPDSIDAPEGWRVFGTKWTGGSCLALAYSGSTVLAATHHAGVARLEPSKPEAGWQSSLIRCGLPMRDADRLFVRVNAIAVGPEDSLVMAGGDQGVFRSRDGGVQFESSSGKEFSEKVALPATWLFCSGAHEVEVVSEDEPGRD